MLHAGHGPNLDLFGPEETVSRAKPSSRKSGSTDAELLPILGQELLRDQHCSPQALLLDFLLAQQRGSQVLLVGLLREQNFGLGALLEDELQEDGPEERPEGAVNRGDTQPREPFRPTNTYLGENHRIL